jgi:nucleotide-binding universal stress UspA family protein
VKCEKHLLMRGNQPGEDLVAFAQENSANLIVIGVKKRSKVGKLMFGSTAQYVILESACPVLAVK